MKLKIYIVCVFIILFSGMELKKVQDSKTVCYKSILYIDLWGIKVQDGLLHNKTQPIIL